MLARLLVLFLSLSLPLPAESAVATLRDSQLKVIALWRDIKSAMACIDEKQATGKLGAVCAAAIAALLEQETKVSLLAAEGWLDNPAFQRVLVLTGKHVGESGVVFVRQVQPEKP